ncbi:MAG: hypothetical protein Q9166_007597 [cf. Caloplaca sp. 2 TL-2023]
MSQSYIEAHRADEAVRSLEQKVSLLMVKNKEQAGKNESFEKKIHGLEKRNEDLETRLKASEYNALARHLNALLPPSSTSHQNLHPLHSIHTNTPLKNFPKKESDIRTMSSLDVANLLKELDADTMKKDAGERKARLKEVIGVGERSSVAQSVGTVDGINGAGEKEKKEEGQKKDKVVKPLPGKATGPPPGKVLPIGPKD